MNETSAAKECETSIGSAQVAAMRRTRNELAMLHENLHGKMNFKKSIYLVSLRNYLVLNKYQ
jgi:hypothetical protein